MGEYEGDNLSTVPPGLDSNFWQPGGQKENIVLTVAKCTTKDRIQIKGVDLLLQVAEKMSETSFQLIGVEENFLSKNSFFVPKNVVVSPSMSQQKLLSYYQRSAVYCQLSRVESFGIATAEAMLCGCIPVVTDVGGLSETIGDTGHTVPPENVGAASEAIHKALKEANSPSGEKCRKRAAKKFTVDHRKESFKAMVFS